MANYLPSKKFILSILLVVGLCIVIFFIVSKSGQKMLGYKNTRTEKDVVALKDIIDRDSDNDGLKDWEESLWGTSIDNPDTDGDGTSDKDEIDNKRKELKLQSGDTTAESDMNETQSLARELFATIASLQASGNLNDQSVTNLSTNIKDSIVSQQLLPDVYTLADLHVVSTSDKSSIAQYHTALTKVTDSYKERAWGDEIYIANNALQQNKPELLETLSERADVYKDFSKDLQAVSVPKEIAPIQLDLMNSAISTGIAITNMSATFDNSLVAVVGLYQYAYYSDKMLKSIDILKTYFQNNGILNT